MRSDFAVSSFGNWLGSSSIRRKALSKSSRKASPSPTNCFWYQIADARASSSASSKILNFFSLAVARGPRASHGPIRANRAKSFAHVGRQSIVVGPHPPTIVPHLRRRNPDPSSAAIVLPSLPVQRQGVPRSDYEYRHQSSSYSPAWSVLALGHLPIGERQKINRSSITVKCRPI